MKKKGFLIGVCIAVVAVAIAAAFWIRHAALPVSVSVTPSVSEVLPVETTMKTTRAEVSSTQETVTTVDVKDDLLLLVNFNHSIPQNYHPELVYVEGEYQTTVDKRIVVDLKAMTGDCRKAGYQPLICSSYRSIKKQKELFQARVRQCRFDGGLSEADAKKEAAKWVAMPGTSEHHTGLAVDIVDINYQLLDEKQESRDTQKWLMQHCWEYGFILRYPTDKSAVTHIHYEPWHYRYVGKENAAKIHQSGLCLEEYLEKNN